jgi:Thiamine pyrophosphate enzyme, N-terminal TPP binding domain
MVPRIPYFLEIAMNSKILLATCRATETSSLPERPALGPPGNVQYGSDAIAGVLRQLDLPFIALNPGASYRGLHDSLVNHLGNVSPRMLLCLHEEHAVAIAHGFAAARLIKSKQPHSLVEVKDLKSGDVTAVALRPG